MSRGLNDISSGEVYEHPGLLRDASSDLSLVSGGRCQIRANYISQIFPNVAADFTAVKRDTYLYVLRFLTGKCLLRDLTTEV